MNILLISDQKVNSNHTAVEGLFFKSLNKMPNISVDVVYFNDENKAPYVIEPHKISVPKKVKHKNMIAMLDSIVRLNEYQIVIVRNFFSVLRQLLSYCKASNIKIGFWESFPHNYRRYEEARRFRKSVIRKTIQWYFKYKLQKKLISQCDFYLPITITLKEDFYPDIKVPSHPLSVGIDAQILPSNLEDNFESQVDCKSFVYTGTIDQLRDVDIILKAFLSVKGDYKLSIYTTSKSSYVEYLKRLSENDKRIIWRASLKRDVLFREIAHSDAAIGLIPNTKTYHCSIATKTLEYYALGIVTILNHLPSYDELFNHKNAFFCNFNVESIQKTIEQIIETPRDKLVEMGRIGQKLILEKKTYDCMAKELIKFLNTI